MCDHDHHHCSRFGVIVIAIIIAMYYHRMPPSSLLHSMQCDNIHSDLNNQLSKIKNNNDNDNDDNNDNDKLLPEASCLAAVFAR